MLLTNSDWCKSSYYGGAENQNAGGPFLTTKCKVMRQVLENWQVTRFGTNFLFFGIWFEIEICLAETNDVIIVIISSCGWRQS